MALRTLQSAIPAHHTRWVKIENSDHERIFRFGPLRQWSLSRIFYSFWAPHGRKLRIGLFDRHMTNWCFWLACDQNLSSVLLRCDGSKFWPGETSYLYANGPESFPPGFFTHFGCSRAENYESVFLTVVRPNGAFDWRATRIYVRSFWPLCDQERPPKSGPNGGLNNFFGKRSIFWGNCKKLFWILKFSIFRYFSLFSVSSSYKICRLL